MLHRSAIIAIAFVAALGSATARVEAQDLAKFPDWKGQWERIGPAGQWDQTKPPVRGQQQPPLTPEYQSPSGPVSNGIKYTKLGAFEGRRCAWAAR
jgi:hypothetical protein